MLHLTVKNVNEWSPSPAGNPVMPLLKLFLAGKKLLEFRDFLELSTPDPEHPPPPSKKYSLSGRVYSLISQYSRQVVGIIQ
jgi:hypothetical protein